jgi:hypothetical protein
LVFSNNRFGCRSDTCSTSYRIHLPSGVNLISTFSLKIDIILTWNSHSQIKRF